VARLFLRGLNIPGPEEDGGAEEEKFLEEERKFFEQAIARPFRRKGKGR